MIRQFNQLFFETPSHWLPFANSTKNGYVLTLSFPIEESKTLFLNAQKVHSFGGSILLETGQTTESAVVAFSETLFLRFMLNQPKCQVIRQSHRSVGGQEAVCREHSISGAQGEILQQLMCVTIFDNCSYAMSATNHAGESFNFSKALLEKLIASCQFAPNLKYKTNKNLEENNYAKQ